MRLNLRTGSLAVVAVACGLIALSTYEAHGAFTKQIKQQRQLVGRMLQFRSAYESLLPTNEAWNALFAPVNAETDVLSIHHKMGLESMGIASSPDDLVVASVSPETWQGQQLKLYRACLSNSNRGFSFLAASPGAALRATGLLASRRDMTFSEIALDETDAGYMRVSVGKLCFFLREDEHGEG